MAQENAAKKPTADIVADAIATNPELARVADSSYQAGYDEGGDPAVVARWFHKRGRNGRLRGFAARLKAEREAVGKPCPGL